jgi:uncharacterized protein YdhG (YjbR/CyaY superfamily)
MTTKFTTIDEYIAAQDDDKKSVLHQFRKIIKVAAPKAEEVISYGMPAFKYGSVLVYFAAGKNHYGFYPTSKPVEVFKDKLKPYKTSKGAIQFPADKPLPQKLITEIVKYRLKEVEKKVQEKQLVKTKPVSKKSNKKIIQFK